MITRRNLLKQSALASAALIAPSRPVIAAPSSAGSAADAAQAVLARQLGAHAESFHFSVIPAAPDGTDVWEASAQNGIVKVGGSSAVAMVRGAYAYLREAAHGMITWSGSHLPLPARLPDWSGRRDASPYRFRQYMNPCTFGYSTAFWDWDRWERELDWMALHGISMPLAMEGQESVWQQVWASFGLTAAEWDRFTTGPAQLPWHRMGNINNFAGPLPQSFINAKRELQNKILRRMSDLGMTPIVPAFGGHIPEALRRVYPDVRTFTLLWAGESSSTVPRATRTCLLHPGETDLFIEIGGRFIREYKKQFGAGEYYLADSFNEMRVPVSAAHRYDELKQFGHTIYRSIAEADQNGKWTMQGWIFVNDPKFWDQPSTEAFLSGVPDDRMLILDYAADLDEMHLGYGDAPDAAKRLNAFFGKQWIGGMAHTFGGNNNIKGDLRLIASKPFEQLRNPHRGHLVGWGLDMEGIETNEVVYELLTDIGWLNTPVNLEDWLCRYCEARYGGDSAAMREAWRLLLQSAYGENCWKTKHAFQARPTLNPQPQYVNTGPVFVHAVQHFISCAPDFGASPLFRNDAIEFVAQAAGGLIDRHLAAACHAHRQNQPDLRDRQAEAALSMMLRVDALLHLREDRRLETWVARAKHWAVSPDEALYYDGNARLLITYWGWRELEDYASRMYSGLIRDYYRGRWSVFFSALRSNQKDQLEEWEQSWLAAAYRPSAPLPVKDYVEESQTLLALCAQFQAEAGS
jgi:alpha-N-acetylglucosaminidase